MSYIQRAQEAFRDGIGEGAMDEAEEEQRRWLEEAFGEPPDTSGYYAFETNGDRLHSGISPKPNLVMDGRMGLFFARGTSNEAAMAFLLGVVEYLEEHPLCELDGWFDAASASGKDDYTSEVGGSEVGDQADGLGGGGE